MLSEAMTWLGQQPDTLFLGQGVRCGGPAGATSFENVPQEKRIEFPVAEDLQLGVAIGLALEGFVPVSYFPRIDFLLCACPQLVLHLDKLPLYSDYRPKVIIRTAVGCKQPLDAGPQHTGDYTNALQAMLSTVDVDRLRAEERALEVYQEAYSSGQSTLIVEG